MKYVYIDGDDIGLRIEQSLMTNDEESLQEINNEVSRAIAQITDYLSSEQCEIIFSGADGIIFKKQSPNIDRICSYIGSLDTSITFSMGVGSSLREAFLALRYAKANGKNGVATLGTNFEWMSNTNKKLQNQTLQATANRRA